MTVELIDAVERPTAVIAAATTWDQFPRLWKVLLDEVYTVVDGRTNVMLYRDDVPHVEVGVLAPPGFVPRGRVVASSLPGGRVARAVHRGPFTELHATHRAVLGWCAEHGHALSGVRWEVYGHHDPDPARLQTEICWALATGSTGV
jgi:GyrI-like small molecule binding domain